MEQTAQEQYQAGLDKHRTELQAQLEQVDALKAVEVPREFKELRSCCGTLYGYMDQDGNEYDLGYKLVEKGWLDSDV